MPEFPGDVSDDALEYSLSELRLAKVAVDPAARCPARSPSESKLHVADGCQAPRELVLAQPELRDIRRDAPWGLGSRARYERTVRRLEAALVRSYPNSHARRQILTWLTAAFTRWRSAGERSASRCGVHYLELLLAEHPPGNRRRAVRYLLALELELAGRNHQALAHYSELADSPGLGIGRSAAFVALGDHAFERSFCDPSLVARAHAHYLAAAHGPAPKGVPLPGYVRLRLAQLELGMNALGPAYRQLELAEQNLYAAPATWVGSRLDRLRRLQRRTLSELVSRAIADGTLRLLAAFEPPGHAFCRELALRSRATDPAERALVDSTLGSWCSFAIDPERACATTAGCTSSTAGAERPLPAK